MVKIVRHRHGLAFLKAYLPILQTFLKLSVKLLRAAATVKRQTWKHLQPQFV